MKFCPNCGRMLLMKYQANRMKLICDNCHYEEEAREKTTIITASKSPSMIIIDEGDELRTAPTVMVRCPRCGNKGAYWWSVQLRGGDESSTQFFRCLNCKMTWRETS